MSRLWVDDERTPPDDTWEWAVNSHEALLIIQDRLVKELSLDHDLGGEDTSRSIVTWMATEEWWPEVITIHSMNVVGSEWLFGTCQRYAPATTTVYRRPFIPRA